MKKASEPKQIKVVEQVKAVEETKEDYTKPDFTRSSLN